MTAPAMHNQHRTSIGFAIESTQGTTPADASAWATALAGANGGRVFVEELDPTFIRGDAAVANVDMEERVFSKKAPHKGLPTADGGSMVMRVWGSGHTYEAGTQVPATLQGTLLTHCLGGGARGNDTAVDTDGVTTQTEFTLADVTNLAAGQIIAFEDADDPGKLHPAQILEIVGTDIVIDREMPFTVAVGDKVYGTEMAYIDQAALTNPQDSNYTTLSLLIQKGPNCWMTGGSHLSLDEIRLERGMQPKVAMGINAAQGYPPGAGAPSVPTYTDTIEGYADVAAIGRRTRCFVQTYGVTTYNAESVHSVTITPGVPVIGVDTVTEVDDGMPGRAGYRTEPADTIIELVVVNADAWQTRWANRTEFCFTYYQVSAGGYCWAIHAPRCKVMESPEPMFEGVNLYRVRLQPADDEDGTGELGKSKIVIARY